MARYQERGHWSNYKKTRKQVCEVYEVDQTKAQIHHIVTRFDALRNILFKDFDLNQVSNLYPFTDDERGERLHATKRDHSDLHTKIDKREPKKVGAKKGRRKKKKKGGGRRRSSKRRR